MTGKAPARGRRGHVAGPPYPNLYHPGLPWVRWMMQYVVDVSIKQGVIPVFPQFDAIVLIAIGLIVLVL